MNLWSGVKFQLAGPGFAGLNFTPPLYPLDAYASDPSIPPRSRPRPARAGGRASGQLGCGGRRIVLVWPGGR